LRDRSSNQHKFRSYLQEYNTNTPIII